MSVDHPIFVPFDREYLAGVVTTPETEPRGLVLLLQGLGASRSHRYNLWTRIARQLADRGIASVRMDYPELGDSTGAFPGDMNDPPIEEAMAIARTALDALGLEAFGVAGNCLGARVGLELASRMPNCASAVLIMPDSVKSILVGEGKTAAHRAAGRVARKTPKLAKIVRRWVHTESIQPRMLFLPEVHRALRHASLLFLWLGRAQIGAHLERGVVDMLEREPDVPSSRARVHTIAATGTSGMRLSLELQPIVIDAIVDWFDETMPGGETDRTKTGLTVTAATGAGGEGTTG